MLVDCERCPGQFVTPPACPSCVVRLLMGDGPPGRGGVWQPERPVAVPELLWPSHRPVEVELVRTVDDDDQELDAAEQRAVATLVGAGLLVGADPDRRRDHVPGTAALRSRLA